MLNVYLDFETFYGQGYSLQSPKLTTMDYVRDSRFEAQGLSMRIGDKGETKYYCGPQEVASAMQHLSSVQEDHDINLIAFNTKFDGLICAERYGFTPEFYTDVKAIAKGLWPHHPNSLQDVARRVFPDDKSKHKLDGLEDVKNVRYEDFTPEQKETLRTYCIRDTDIMVDIYQTIKEWMPESEHQIIHLTTRMFVEPEFVLDFAIMRELSKEINHRQAMLVEEMIVLFHEVYPQICRKTFTSNQRFADFLVNGLGIPEQNLPTKISKTTGKVTHAFGKNDVPYIQFTKKYPQYRFVFNTREELKSSIARSRAEALVKAASGRPDNDQKLCVPLVYYQAHTGRYGGNERINLQNLQRGSKHRLALTAPEGHQVLVYDSSNIEARMLAWFAGEQSLLDQYRNGDDTYSVLASKIFSMPVNKKDNPGERSIGKVACIAEGQRVLTDVGLVPIEKVTVGHQLWDGVSFVSHDGVIYKGEKETITYDGLTATPDHRVFTESGYEILFGQAASQMERLERSAFGEQTIRTRENYLSKGNEKKRSTPCKNPMYQVQTNKTKTRVYDILNAGPRNRFTVEGKLVHNCLGLGFQMGAPRFKETLESGPMGMPPMACSMEFADKVVSTYRAENPNIKRSWKTAQNMIREMTIRGNSVPWGPLVVMERCIMLPNGMFLQYPDLSVTEVETIYGTNYEYNYKAYDFKSKKFVEKKIYGGKLIENIIQALARIVIMQQMIEIDAMLEQFGGKVTLQVHDEIICIVPDEFVEQAEEQMQKIMSNPPSWCPDLPLACEGGYDKNYSK